MSIAERGTPIRADAAGVSLLRWLLGGLAPLAMFVALHNGFFPGLPKHALMAPFMPVSMAVPATAIVVSHLVNWYVLQGVGLMSVGRVLRICAAALVVLPLTAVFVSMIGFGLGLFVSISASLSRTIATAPGNGPDLIVALGFAPVYAACGWLFGAVMPLLEELARPVSAATLTAPAPPPPVPGLARAGRRGGAIAALILGAGWLFHAPWRTAAAAASWQAPSPMLAATMVLAGVPALILSWRALGDATPQPATLPTDGFAIRLAIVLLAILTLTSVEAAISGSLG